MSKIVDYFKIEMDKGLILLFIVLSIIVGTVALASFFQPDCSWECFNAPQILYVLIRDIVGLIAIPVTSFFSQIFFVHVMPTYSTEFWGPHYYDSLYSSPSLIKFIPVIVTYIYTFIIGLLVVLIIINLSNSNNKKFRIKHAITKFRNYCILWIFAAIFYMLFTTPTAPFASDNQIISYCSSDDYYNCMDDFLHYKLENCEGKTQFFLYPLLLEMPKKDICFLNNFIEKSPFKDILFYIPTTFLKFDVDLLTIFYSNITATTPHLEDDARAMTESLLYFSDIIKDMDMNKKRQFCRTFSNNMTKEYLKFAESTYTPSFTNGDYCMAALGITPEENELNIKICRLSLTKQYYYGNDLQKACFTKYSRFNIYVPDDKMFDEEFGDKWSNDQSFKIIKEDENSLDLAYRLMYRIRYEDLDKFGEIYITEASRNENVALDFRDKEIEERTMSYRPGYPYRISISKNTINNVDVYIEKAKGPKRENISNEYYIFYFVIPGNHSTYVRIDGEYAYGMGIERQKEFFLKLARSMIVNNKSISS